MSAARQRLAEAELAAATARGRFAATLELAKEQVSPQAIIGLIGKAAREQSETLADRLVAKLTSRPMLTTLALSILGALLRRDSVVRLIFGQFFGRAATRRKARHSAIGKGASPDEEQV